LLDWLTVSETARFEAGILNFDALVPGVSILPGLESVQADRQTDGQNYDS